MDEEGELLYSGAAEHLRSALGGDNPSAVVENSSSKMSLTKMSGQSPKKGTKRPCPTSGLKQLPPKKTKPPPPVASPKKKGTQKSSKGSPTKNESSLKEC